MNEPQPPQSEGSDSQASADTMPAETENPCPSGLPIATTQSPTRIRSELPNWTKGSAASDFTLSSAISVLGSVPTSSAFSFSPEKNSTWISSAPSITWLFVTM